MHKPGDRCASSVPLCLLVCYDGTQQRVGNVHGAQGYDEGMRVSRCTHLRAIWPRCTAQNTSISPTSGHHPSQSSHPLHVYMLHTTTTVVTAEGRSTVNSNHAGKGKATAASGDHSSHCDSSLKPRCKISRASLEAIRARQRLHTRRGAVRTARRLSTTQRQTPVPFWKPTPTRAALLSAQW